MIEKNKKIIAVILVLFTAVLIYSKAELKIHFIDAGEGDSIFIEFPDNKNTLVDAGNFKTGVNVYCYLKKLRVKKIDNLILTHPHPDHIGGVFTIAQILKVDNFFDNGDSIDYVVKKEDVYRWYNDFFRKDVRYKKLIAPFVFEFGEAKLRVLWPEDFVSEDWNANSLVLLIEYNEFKCLLMGDATVFTEKELLAKYSDLKSNVLKAGHHGADDTASIDFINNVKPEVVIISINDRNIRDYPSEKTVKDYKSIGARIYYTYIDKNICVEVNKNGKYRIRTGD